MKYYLFEKNRMLTSYWNTVFWNECRSLLFKSQIVPDMSLGFFNISFKIKI